MCCCKADTLGIRRPEFPSQLYGLGMDFTAVAPLSSPVREGPPWRDVSTCPRSDFPRVGPMGISSQEGARKYGSQV